MGFCMTAQMDAEVTWFTNGNCLIQDGQRYAGAVMVSDTKIIWAEPLPFEVVFGSPADRSCYMISRVPSGCTSLFGIALCFP